MKFILKNILIFIFAATQAGVLAQMDPSGISRVENGRIQYTLDTRWTNAQKKEVETLFSLDSTVWAKISVETSQILLDSTMWNLRHISQNIFELSKDIESIPPFHFNENDIFLISENWGITPGYVDQDKVIYGINKFKKPQNFKYENGRALIYLSGHAKARQAYIAGSFNNWNPSQTSMQKADSGWIVNLSLPEGKYLYKFILDGTWIEDPDNTQSENDGQGNINSVFFCTNYNFQLAGYTKARKVILTGTFNSWNRREFKMVPGNGGWSLPVYLRDGTYSYKFIVDDQWMTDPANPKTRTDAKGNLNSVTGKGEEFVFHLKGNLSAGKVILSGSFNNWDPDELVMEKTKDGWQLTYQLAPGNYEYKFLSDGSWIPDPDNSYSTGSGNFINSCMSFKPNHTFQVSAFPNANEVRLSGSFNNWNPEGYKMVKKDGIWTFPIYLSKGKHLYKLIVDGEWVTDPTNRLWEDNEYGTGNSVLWIMDAEF